LPDPTAAPPALVIDSLSYSYPEAKPAGRAVVDVRALRVERGEQVLLTGSSGSGKSTLLHLIAGLADPDGGNVLVAGQNIHALRGAARDSFRGRHIGMIFQTFNLLQGFSALENVMAALMFSAVPRAEHAKRAAALLDQLEIRDHASPPERLSVGQQQRVAVARAIACSPELVLADEPTASLDPENAAGAVQLIQHVCREKNAALVCVSHDPAMRERFPRALSLGDLRS